MNIHWNSEFGILTQSNLKIPGIPIFWEFWNSNFLGIPIFWGKLEFQFFGDSKFSGIPIWVVTRGKVVTVFS
jgi:hypothetical protein